MKTQVGTIAWYKGSQTGKQGATCDPEESQELGQWQTVIYKFNEPVDTTALPGGCIPFEGYGGRDDDPLKHGILVNPQLWTKFSLIAQEHLATLPNAGHPLFKIVKGLVRQTQHLVRLSIGMDDQKTVYITYRAGHIKRERFALLALARTFNRLITR